MSTERVTSPVTITSKRPSTQNNHCHGMDEGCRLVAIGESSFSTGSPAGTCTCTIQFIGKYAMEKYKLTNNRDSWYENRSFSLGSEPLRKLPQGYSDRLLVLGRSLASVSLRQAARRDRCHLCYPVCWAPSQSSYNQEVLADGPPPSRTTRQFPVLCADHRTRRASPRSDPIACPRMA